MWQKARGKKAKPDLKAFEPILLIFHFSLIHFYAI